MASVRELAGSVEVKLIVSVSCEAGSVGGERHTYGSYFHYRWH